MCVSVGFVNLSSWRRSFFLIGYHFASGAIRRIGMRSRHVGLTRRRRPGLGTVLFEFFCSWGTGRFHFLRFLLFASAVCDFLTCPQLLRRLPPLLLPSWVTLVSPDLCFFLPVFFFAAAPAEGHLAGKPDKAKNKEWRKKLRVFVLFLNLFLFFGDAKGRKKIGRENKATGRRNGQLARTSQHIGEPGRFLRGRLLSSMLGKKLGVMYFALPRFASSWFRYISGTRDARRVDNTWRFCFFSGWGFTCRSKSSRRTLRCPCLAFSQSSCRSKKYKLEKQTNRRRAKYSEHIHDIHTYIHVFAIKPNT